MKRSYFTKWSAASLLVAVVVALLAIAAITSSTYQALGWERGNNAAAWTKGATLKVCVDELPADPPAGITADVLNDAVTEAISEWNTAQAEFGGLTLETDGATKANCDIHISWEKNRRSWGSTFPKSSYDKDNNGYGKETVRVVIEIGDGINERGITRTLKHELGHAEGLGHSEASDLMKAAAYSSTPGRSPSVDDINSADPYTEPTADDKAGKKELWGTAEELSKSSTTAMATPVGPITQYDYWVEAAIVCGVSLCTDNITEFVVEIADQALDDADLTAPFGWTGELLDARSNCPCGKPLDTGFPRSSSLARFTTTPSQGIAPGDEAHFVVTTAIPASTVRVYTNSPSYDSDETIVTGPGGPVGGTTELLTDASATPSEGSSSGGDAELPLAAAVVVGTVVALGAGGWYARRRWLN